MSRQGYYAEYKCKKENEETYGVGNCIKVAIGGSSDYLIAYKGRLIKFIEVKETKKDTYYPSDRERQQFAKLVSLGKHHNIPVELWVYFKRKKGRPSIKHVRHIYGKQDTEKTSHGNIKVSGRPRTIIPKQRKIIRKRPPSKQDERQEPAPFRESNPQLGGEGKIL
jgi:hypothetical protein